MADIKTTVSLQGQGQVEAGLASLSNKFKGLNGTTQQLGSQIPIVGSAMSMLTNPITLVTAGTAALGAAMYKCIDAAADEEAQINRLSNQLKVVGMSYSGTAKDSIDGFITSMERMTTYGDGDVRPVLGNMIQLTGDLAKSQDILTIAADMAASGQGDLAGNAQMVFKAFEGNTMALGKLIPSLSESALKTKNFATEADKTKYIAEQLRSTFGGMAKGEVSTLNGAIKQLGNEVGNLQEDLGTPLLDPIKNATLGFKDMVAGTRTLVSESANIPPAFKAIAAEINPMIGAIDSVNNIINLFGAGLRGLGLLMNAHNIAAENVQKHTENENKSFEDQTSTLESATSAHDDLIKKRDELNKKLANASLNFTTDAEVKSLGSELDDINKKIAASETKISAYSKEQLDIDLAKLAANKNTLTSTENISAEISTLSKYQNTLTAGTKEYYENQGKIADLEVKLADEKQKQLTSVGYMNDAYAEQMVYDNDILQQQVDAYNNLEDKNLRIAMIQTGMLSNAQERLEAELAVLQAQRDQTDDEEKAAQLDVDIYNKNKEITEEKKKSNKFAAIGENLAKKFSSTLSQTVVNGGDLGDAFKNMAIQLAAAVAQAALLSAMGLGSFSSIFSGLFEHGGRINPVPQYAASGFTAKGSDRYVVGVSAGEAVLSRQTVNDNSNALSYMTGRNTNAQRSSNVTVNINGSALNESQLQTAVFRALKRANYASA